jgi:prolipoprotein diacylglyceryltransferase
MHPVLFHLGALPVGTHGVLIGLGFVLGLILLRTLAGRDGLPPGQVVKAAVLIALGMLVGARLGHVLMHWTDFRSHPLAMFRFWDGEVSSYGAAAGGLIVAAASVGPIYRLPVWRTADLLAPALALGAYFGRLGCLAAGCGWGIPSPAPWALSFPAQSQVFRTYHDLYQSWALWWPALRPGIEDWGAMVHPGATIMGPAASNQVNAALDALAAQAQTIASGAVGYLQPDQAMYYVKTVPLHPTPVYLALGLLVLFTFTLWLLRRRRFYGQVFWAGILGWAGLRALVEPWRGDVRILPEPLAPLTLTQAWCLALALLAVVMSFVMWRRSRTRVS